MGRGKRRRAASRSRAHDCDAWKTVMELGRKNSEGQRRARVPSTVPDRHRHDPAEHLRNRWIDPFMAHSAIKTMISSQQVVHRRRDAYYMHAAAGIWNPSAKRFKAPDRATAEQMLRWAHGMNLPAVACFKAVASGKEEGRAVRPPFFVLELRPPADVFIRDENLRHCEIVDGETVQFKLQPYKHQESYVYE